MTIRFPVVGIGLVWAAIWAILAMFAGTVLQFAAPGQIDPGEEPRVLAPMIALAGLICGVVFAGLLSIVMRPRPVLKSPLVRAAICGAFVTAALPIVMGKDAGQMLLTAPLGAFSAVASVVIVKKWAAWRSRPHSLRTS